MTWEKEKRKVDPPNYINILVGKKMAKLYTYISSNNIFLSVRTLKEEVGLVFYYRGTGIYY